MSVCVYVRPFCVYAYLFVFMCVCLCLCTSVCVRMRLCCIMYDLKRKVMIKLNKIFMFSL